MFFGVEPGPDFEHRADVVTMHVIDAEYSGPTLKMHRDRCTGVTEIVAVVIGPNPGVPVPGKLKPMRIINMGLEFVLFSEAAAMVQIALKNVGALRFKKIQRHLFALRF